VNTEKRNPSKHLLKEQNSLQSVQVFQFLDSRITIISWLPWHITAIPWSSLSYCFKSKSRVLSFD